MQNTVSKISSKIIYAHMTNREFDPSNLSKLDSYKIAFYDENKKKIFGNIEDKIDFSKELIQKNEHYILIDDSVLGHLGVYFIVIKEDLYSKKISELKIQTLIFFLFIYSLISIMGFYLARLFIKPIKEEREKLNNFIRDTTHELNTPISAILMSTENEVLSAKQIERVRLSAKRISEMYKDLIYIFLEDKEKKEINIYNLKTLIYEQLEYFEPLASKKRIKMDLDMEDFNYKINRDDFIRIVNNLISNAIKYNKMGGKISIKLKDKSIIISDTGIGIPEEKIKDIYKRYYRATSEQGGFGIGLNIVNHICKKYNIKIDVNSQISKGTSFTLSF